MHQHQGALDLRVLDLPSVAFRALVHLQYRVSAVHKGLSAIVPETVNPTVVLILLLGLDSLPLLGHSLLIPQSSPFVCNGSTVF